MRFFVALDIPDAIRQSIQHYVDDLRRLAPDAKWVKPESYHITLKFIGEWKRPPQEILAALERIQAAPIGITFRGSGFFPNPRSPRVFWAGIHADENLVALARAVDESTALLGIEREDHDYSPHLTLARSGSGSPRAKRNESSSPSLKYLSGRIAGQPEPKFGTMHATEFFLYESKLSPSGARYSKLVRFPLVSGR